MVVLAGTLGWISNAKYVISPDQTVAFFRMEKVQYHQLVTKWLVVLLQQWYSTGDQHCFVADRFDI